jgi:hypothetical protein
VRGVVFAGSNHVEAVDSVYANCEILTINDLRDLEKGPVSIGSTSKDAIAA